jgi:hypothetical protein
VRDDAWIHAAPDDALRFRFKANGGPLADHEAHRFEVLADHGDWIQLTPAQPSGWPPRTCAYPLFELSGLAVALWVKREALVPLTTRMVVQRFDDGTQVAIVPGTPVGPARDSDGWRLVATADVSLFAPIPEDAVGLSFEGWAEPRKEPPAPKQRLRAGARLTFATSELLRVEDASSRVTRIEPGKDETKLWLELDCVRAVVRTYASNLVQRDEPEGGGGLGVLGALGAGSWVQIAGRTVVYWPDGRPAGVHRGSSHTLASRFTPRGDMRCFTSVIGEQGPEAERTVVFCYRAVDLREGQNPLQLLAPGEKKK